MAQSKNVADDLTQLIETANAPIFGIDTEGKISVWNRKTAEITGLHQNMNHPFEMKHQQYLSFFVMGS